MKTGKSNKMLTYVLLVGLILGLTITEASADGTETLGIPSVDIASGSGIVARGVGLITQPGIINIDVPDDATVKQVLLYWEGQHKIVSGDNTIEVNGNTVTGTLIGGPTLFFYSGGIGVKSSSYRSDITNLNIVHAGPNVIAVGGLTFNNKNDGAGILVIYENGKSADIQLRDGNDLAYRNFVYPLNTTETQTFTFEPSTTDRAANISMFVSSIFEKGKEFRPSVVDVKVGDVLTEYIDVLNSSDGYEWDTLNIPVNIPAGVTSLSVKVLSENKGVIGGNPASIAWTTVALSVPKEIEQLEGRMTGGGSVLKGDMRVTHGFEIHCDLSEPNNIEVNWPGNKFHMKDMTSAVCTDSPLIDQKPPKAPFDTFTGKGIGKLNGVDGAKIEFIFTDAGEPGKKDIATIKIWNNANNKVLDVSGFLKNGNHQAHKN